jgi:hypothetical protein
MSKVIFTRYLYVFDEVGMSLLYSILKAKCLDECYFWLSELYLSGLQKQTWELIWFIYYDFYYVLNPQFEIFIRKKSIIGDLKSLLTIVKNLFKFTSSSHVFITRQYHCHIKNITQLFRGKKPKWLTSIPIKYHGLFRFIDKKLYHLAVSSLPDIVDDELFQSLQLYFKLTDEHIEQIQKRFYNDIMINDTESQSTQIHSQYIYQNHIHTIWSVICLLLFNPEYSTTKKKIYIASSNNELDEIIKHQNEPISLNKYNNEQIYKTLEFKRLYSINPICSSFQLLREQVPDINICYREHWEYYAYLSPVWYERFNQYDITIDHAMKQIIFNNDDELEQFYSLFGYEPDEQSYETENKRIVSMPRNNWKTWYDDVFEQPSIYEFNDDFRFAY